MEVMHPRCCGIDIHKESVVACLRLQEGRRAKTAVRRFGTTTAELLRLHEWLSHAACPHVAMESTSVYWKPVFNLLEGSFEVVLANAYHIKAVPGRTAFSQVNLGNNTNWRVYNGMPATSKFWDINPATKTTTGISFPIQQFLTQSSGSFAIYLLANYNVDVTGKTLTSAVNWTAGTYKTRSTDCAATPGYVRFEFQDVTAGPFNENDYWWSTGTTDPNLVLNLDSGCGGTLTASLVTRANWSNLCGHSATDTGTYNDGITGNANPVSPYDGFTHAVKSVKQVGLAFGSSCRYASGVALDVQAGTFNMTKFTITAP